MKIREMQEVDAEPEAYQFSVWLKIQGSRTFPIDSGTGCPLSAWLREWSGRDLGLFSSGYVAPEGDRYNPDKREELPQWCKDFCVVLRARRDMMGPNITGDNARKVLKVAMEWREEVT